MALTPCHWTKQNKKHSPVNSFTICIEKKSLNNSLQILNQLTE